MKTLDEAVNQIINSYHWVDMESQSLKIQKSQKYKYLNKSGNHLSPRWQLPIYVTGNVASCTTVPPVDDSIKAKSNQ